MTLSLHLFVAAFLALVMMQVSQVSSFWASSTRVVRSPVLGDALLFKKKDDANGDDGEIGDYQQPMGRWRRFIPRVIRSRLEKRIPEPEPDTAQRYHLRIVNTQFADKRHTITRIVRFLPDVKWETAEEMVDRSIDRGAALVRVFNSLAQARQVHTMLARSDPPVTSEVYDSKKDEVLVL